MKFYLKFCVFLIWFFSYSNGTKEIFLNYGVANEGYELFKYFHNVDNGYFVDIGAYDHLYASNTLNLRAMGWSGVNIDASPDRLPRFSILRKGEANLNFAIGDHNRMIPLY